MPARILYEIKIVKTRSYVAETGFVQIVKRPQDILDILKTIQFDVQENFVLITLNGNGEVINTRILTKGLINHSLIDPREIYRNALKDNAVSIIVAHNHPSGSLDASPQDIAITRQINEAGALIGIRLMDHVIVSKNGYTSMKEEDLI